MLFVGARAADIDSILITDHGVHKEDLLDDEEEEEDDDTVENKELEKKYEKVLLPMGKEEVIAK